MAARALLHGAGGWAQVSIVQGVPGRADAMTAYTKPQFPQPPKYPPPARHSPLPRHEIHSSG